MRNLIGVISGFAVASFVPAVFFAVWYRLYDPLFPIVFTVPHIWVASVLFFFLNRLTEVKLWMVLLAGFLIGAIPMAVWSFPLASWNQGGAYIDLLVASKSVVPGHLTSSVWVGYVKSFLFTGSLGILCAFVFAGVYAFSGWLGNRSAMSSR
jgi:hypothetical protein